MLIGASGAGVLQAEAQNSAYLNGYNASMNHFKWFNSLFGDAYAGALQGENSSTVLPQSVCPDKSQNGCHIVPCPDLGKSPGWIAACQEEERQSNDLAAQETEDPDFKLGADAAASDFITQYKTISGQTAFDQCAANAAESGSYSSDDNGQSVKALVLQCNDEATNWLNHCEEERGESKKQHLERPKSNTSEFWAAPPPTPRPKL